MKQILFLLVSVFTLSFNAGAGISTARYLNARELLEQQGYTIGADYYGYISQGQTFSESLKFEAYTDYEIIAISDDDDVSDLDLTLMTPYETVAEQDADASNIAVVSFSTSAYDVTRKVEVKNYSSRTPYYSSKCRFIIGYK